MTFYANQPKIESLGNEAPYDVFAAVTTDGELQISLHSTLKEAQEEAVSRVADDYWIEDGEIVDRGPGIDYSCYAGRLTEQLIADIKSDETSDIYSLAATLKVWSDALQKALEISEK